MNWDPSRITDHHVPNRAWKQFVNNFIILLHFLAVPSKAASQSAFKMAKIHRNDTGKFNKNVPQWVQNMPEVMPLGVLKFSWTSCKIPIYFVERLIFFCVFKIDDSIFPCLLFKSIFDNFTLLYARTIRWQMEIGTRTSWTAQTGYKLWKVQLVDQYIWPFAGPCW